MISKIIKLIRHKFLFFCFFNLVFISLLSNESANTTWKEQVEVVINNKDILTNPEDIAYRLTSAVLQTNNNLLISLNGKNIIKIDLSTSKVIFNKKSSVSGILLLDFLEEDRFIYVTDKGDIGTITQVKDELKVEKLYQFNKKISYACFSHIERRVAFTDTKKVYFFDIKNKVVTSHLEENIMDINAIAYHPNESKVLLAYNMGIIVYDRSLKKEFKTELFSSKRNDGYQVQKGSFSSDGSSILIESENGWGALQFGVYSSINLKLLKICDFKSNSLHPLDNNNLAILSMDRKKITIFQLDIGKVIFEIEDKNIGFEGLQSVAGNIFIVIQKNAIKIFVKK